MIGAARLAALFETWGFPPEQRPHGRQLELLTRLTAVYAAAGVLDDVDHPRPLCDVCPSAPTCWDGRDAVRRAGTDGDGGVLLPWVGPDYLPGRDVAIVAINPNIGPDDPTDLLLEHGITWEQHVGGLAAGDDRPGGSRFAYGAMRGAAALLDVADGVPVRDRPPEELAPLVARTARLQSVKCVPRTDASEPLAPMWHECPPRFLGAELDVLRPRFVLALGRDPQWAVAQLDGYAARRIADPRLVRGILRRDGWTAEVYGAPHPARASHGEPGERALLRSLGARQRRS